MKLTLTASSSLLFLLAAVHLGAADIDEATIQAVLQQTPEIPAVPTKNGYYVFVPYINSTYSYSSSSTSSGSSTSSQSSTASQLSTTKSSTSSGKSTSGDSSTTSGVSPTSSTSSQYTTSSLSSTSSGLSPSSSLSTSLGSSTSSGLSTSGDSSTTSGVSPTSSTSSQHTTSSFSSTSSGLSPSSGLTSSSGLSTSSDSSSSDGSSTSGGSSTSSDSSSSNGSSASGTTGNRIYTVAATKSGLSTSSSTDSSSTTATSSTSSSTCSKQMRGINRSGAEYSCVKNLGIFEGPIDDSAIKSMKKWNINVVRIPLNEDCWLGINGHTASFIGDNYKTAVKNYVSLLRKNDLKVILDLHWTDGIYGGKGQGDCYDKTAKCQKPMPDKENAPKFWASVAAQFKDDDGVIFDLFNEPFPDMVIDDKTSAWKCWRDGGSACTGFSYEVAGMQDLIDAVRSAGAKNQVMVPGITWSNDLSQWLDYLPTDSANNIAASWHSYNFNSCNNKNCWDSQIAPIAEKYTVIVGEMGEHGCSHTYIDGLMDWLDEKKISYVGWTWNTWDCSSGPALISSYDGTPTDFGKGLRDHLQSTTISDACPSSTSTTSSSSGSTSGTTTSSTSSPSTSASTSSTSTTGTSGLSTSTSSNSVTSSSTSTTSKSSTSSTTGSSSTSSSSSSGTGSAKTLRGVNRSGTEYSCVKNLGIFEGPTDDAAIKTMKGWNINAVRVPLNEDCWLGLNGHTASYIGDNYKTAVKNYVKQLRANDLTVVLDLHWTDGIYSGQGQGDCTDKAAKCQKPMPDKENAPAFWKSVAAAFKDDSGIIFDLFNEPFPDMVISDKTAAWKCLRDGGSACSGFSYEVAGMQDLVDAVRSTGATNQVMVPGLTWTNDLSQWQEYKPTDSQNNMAASWHSYNFNSCNNKECWEKEIAPVAEKYPVIVGEIGEHGCTHSYIHGLMEWLDEKNISYLGWTWNTWDCSSGPSLISSYDGTPTEFGRGLKEHFSKANNE